MGIDGCLLYPLCLRFAKNFPLDLVVNRFAAAPALRDMRESTLVDRRFSSSLTTLEPVLSVVMRGANLAA